MREMRQSTHQPTIPYLLVSRKSELTLEDQLDKVFCHVGLFSLEALETLGAQPPKLCVSFRHGGSIAVCSTQCRHLSRNRSGYHRLLKWLRVIFVRVRSSKTTRFDQVERVRHVTLSPNDVSRRYRHVRKVGHDLVEKVVRVITSMISSKCLHEQRQGLFESNLRWARRLVLVFSWRDRRRCEQTKSRLVTGLAFNNEASPYIERALSTRRLLPNDYVEDCGSKSHSKQREA